MKWLWLLVACTVAACATGGADRHALVIPPHAPATWALDGVEIAAPRAGQLSASRLWERSGPSRAVIASDDDELRQSFVEELARKLPLDPDAPRRLRATLTLQDTGYYEGLAAETTDVTLTAELLDDSGNVIRTITLREAASAPLQRSASRRQRLQAAFDRLAGRLAAML